VRQPLTPVSEERSQPTSQRVDFRVDVVDESPKTGAKPPREPRVVVSAPPYFEVLADRLTKMAIAIATLGDEVRVLVRYLTDQRTRISEPPVAAQRTGTPVPALCPHAFTVVTVPKAQSPWCILSAPRPKQARHLRLQVPGPALAPLGEQERAEADTPGVVIRPSILVKRRQVTSSYSPAYRVMGSPVQYGPFRPSRPLGLVDRYQPILYALVLKCTRSGWSRASVRSNALARITLWREVMVCTNPEKSIIVRPSRHLIGLLAWRSTLPTCCHLIARKLGHAPLFIDRRGFEALAQLPPSGAALREARSNLSLLATASFWVSARTVLTSVALMYPGSPCIYRSTGRHFGPNSRLDFSGLSGICTIWVWSQGKRGGLRFYRRPGGVNIGPGILFGCLIHNTRGNWVLPGKTLVEVSEQLALSEDLDHDSLFCATFAYHGFPQSKVKPLMWKYQLLYTLIPYLDPLLAQHLILWCQDAECDLCARILSELLRRAACSGRARVAMSVAIPSLQWSPRLALSQPVTLPPDRYARLMRKPRSEGVMRSVAHVSSRHALSVGRLFPHVESPAFYVKAGVCFDAPDPAPRVGPWSPFSRDGLDIEPVPGAVVCRLSRHEVAVDAKLRAKLGMGITDARDAFVIIDMKCRYCYLDFLECSCYD